MAEEHEVRPKITAEEIKRMEVLSREIAEFRKSLAPKFEAIAAALTDLSHKEDVVALMDFEGKDTLKIAFKWDNKPMEVIFKSKRC
jgi:hypothetical protein